MLLCLAVAARPAGAAGSQQKQEQLDALAARYAKLEADLARTESRVGRLEVERREADRVFAQRTQALSRRAVYLYKQGGPARMLGGLLLARDAAAFRKQADLLEVMSGRDAMLVDEVEIAQARADDLRRELEATRKRQQDVLNSLRTQQRALQTKLDEAVERERALARDAEKAKQAKEAKAAQAKAKARAAGEAPRRAEEPKESSLGGGGPAEPPAPARRGRVLPIVGPVGFADTWGAPRSGGRRHQGTDLMAPCGAKVVAVSDGVVSMQEGGNGGRMLWLRTGTGDTYFYAHLDSYAEGIRSGQRVGAGQLIAYNGNSGNARGGPCHVHFEWHPRGGEPVNPYRMLREMA